MSQSNRKKIKNLKRMAGRRSWEGVKPYTRVIPNKKKATQTRKAKHKGRLFGRPFCFSPSCDVFGV